MRSVLSYSLIGICIIVFILGFTSKKTQCISDALKKEAVQTLRTVLKTQSEWVKVHAAEFLLWSGYPQGVREIYLEEEKQWGGKSPYRIGIWRVLSQAAINAEEKKFWRDKILKAFLDTNGTDRIHAAETLAKLHISPFTEHPVRTTESLDSPVRSLSLYTRWSVAFTSQDSLLNVRKSFLEITTSRNEDAPYRKLAAYVLRNSGGLPPAEWEILAQSALNEPEGSEVKINLLNAALITTPDDASNSGLYSHVYEAFLKYKNGSKKSIQMEIAAGLAEKGNREDLPILISYLKNENPLGQDTDDADVRASASYAILKMSIRQAQIN